MTDFDAVDFFTDQSLVSDPYHYFDHLRSKCPVAQATPFNVMAITGYDEAVAVYKDPAFFSSCNSLAGPFSGFPFGPDGADDVSDLIEEHRHVAPMAEHISNQDPPLHTRTRSLMNRLITPKRLKENEEFMWRLADQQLDTFLGRGSCEFLADYAKPFSLLVIADLLGVPQEDHEEFKAQFSTQVAGELGEGTTAHNPLQWLNEKFYAYIEDRRRSPRGDVLTELAQAKYEDESTPEIEDVMNLSTFLFAAGTETTTKLVSAAVRVIGENPELQASLREDRTKITAFLEETLRMESPVKAHFRLARKTTTVGGVEVPAGTTVMLLPGACNRDERKFKSPNTFDADRPNVREQIAFIRGVHSCPGAPLARAEGRISMNRVLDRMADIAISDAHHGPANQRHYEYEPTFILRGLRELHLTFTPVG
ncbi:cytochrome P450 [Mycobacterium sp. 852014-50255_SCH5639931]|uniref:cytochrome P450 n=1 Tax=Mycobacterium sp. 852014-50255_SCH5639931 TaxID=1834112 RepID=UPI0007FF93AB|nr:cytochrome P450 [Mycobacterium sp. 852014-50255_SCH5639931]OBB69167.1 cytochrome [Mycobacterium sp. 852014-50255_SCH5639931]